MLVRSFAMGLLMGLTAASGALAVQQSKSKYSTIDLEKCARKGADGGARAWLCPGLPGFPVHVAIAGHRTFFSPGPEGSARRAARQSLGSASTLFDGRSQRAAIEWRFVIRDKKVVPYASIVRFFTQSLAGRGEVVIVTKIGDTDSCQVAWIDALANRDAMVLARTIADRQARSFNCSRDPEIAGSSGKSAM